MPTAGPYGITQFDAPGILSVYQQAQENRIRSLILQKQLAKETREEANQSGIQKAVQAYFGGSGASAGAAPPAAQGGAPAAPTAAPAPSTAAPAASHGPSAADREKLFGSLMAIDPEVASQYMNAFSKMDKAQVDQFSERNTGVMQIAAGLLQLPPEQRKGAIQQHAPELQQYGFTPEQIAGFDPSDANLRQLVVSHMDAERIAQFVKPEYHAVAQGGSLVETNPTGSRTVYETPTVEVGGDVYPRPQGMSGIQKPMTATNPKTHEKIQFNPSTNRWEPIGGQPGSAPAGGFSMTNNPGALRVPGSARFQEFGSPQEGIHAQEALLGRYLGRGLNSVARVIETYAPRKRRGGDNTDEQVDNYIHYVARRLGVNPADTLAPTMVPRLAEAMREIETGRRQ